MEPTEYEKIDAINWSTLKHMRDSPAHYLAALDADRKASKAMNLGSATHAAILEPERVPTMLALWDGGRKAGKAWEAFEAANADRLIVKPDEFSSVCAMAEAVHAHPEASRLLALPGRSETPITWLDPATGLRCKGLLDRHTDGILIDLKTTRSTDPRFFASQAARLGYHLQLAHYATGLEVLTGSRPAVYMIAVENAAPFDVAVYLLTDDVIIPAQETVGELLVKVAECRASGHWPGRNAGIVPLDLPQWALGEPEITFPDEE